MKAFSTQEIAGIIAEEISAMTGLSIDEIPQSQGFLELGLESLQAVSIVEKVGKRISQKIDVTAMFDYPSILSLSQFLSGEKDSSYNNSHRHMMDDLGATSAIAIVGMSGRFPKAHNLEEFQHNLVNKVHGIEEIGVQRWGPTPDRAINFIGALSDYDQFPADAFGISELEAQRMDPQQRLVLEEAWFAIEDAGYSAEELRGSMTGVFVGISSSDYTHLVQQEGQIDIFSATGNAHSIAANRVSYFFDFKGPSLAIDTACSSSLVAVHLAMDSLRRGEIDLAIVAGVNLVLTPELSEAFSGATMLSPDGRCASFSKNANGYVRGEGVGVVLLKRQADAIEDRIYALVKGSAINQDGKSNGLTAPNGKAQEAVIREALRRAQIEPQAITYHEAHGTGTPLGDPVEMLALQRVHQGRTLPLLVGSVKTNIGHLEAAAGIAGFIKLALSLYHKKIFPNLHFDELNLQLKDKIPALKVADRGSEWTASSAQPRCGSVSSFGFGGTNACLILSESTEAVTQVHVSPVPQGIVAVAGFSSNSNEGALQSLEKFAQSIESLDWNTVCANAQATLSQRMSLPHRVLISAESQEELLERIRSHKAKSFQVGVPSQRICFLFTGQGSQYTQMYFAHYSSSNSFKKRVDDLLRDAQLFYPLNLFEVWTDRKYEKELQQTDYGQILLFIFQLVFAEHIKKECNVEPEFVFGHSLGEIIAAVFSGILSESEGLILVAYRGRLMRNTAVGAMTAVFATKVQLDPLMSSGLKLDYAAFNGPQLQVVSGAIHEIEKLETLLTEKAFDFRRMTAQQAFHSALMDPILDVFADSIHSFQFRSSNYKFISSATGELLRANDTLDAGYWKNQLRSPTQFEKAMTTLKSSKATVFIELGPQPVLNGMAQRIIQDVNSTWIHFFESAEKAGSVYANGLIRGLLQAVFHVKTKQRVFDLPKTVFSKKSFLISKKPTSKPVLSSSTKAANPAEILDQLVEIVASVMRVPKNEISVDENLVDLGADSLVLMNAIQSIKDNYHVAIPVSEVFKTLNTMQKMADFVCSEIMQKQPEVMQSQNIKMPSASFTSLGKEKKGVLGNFRTFASLEKSQDEANERKQYLQTFIKDFNSKTPKTKAHVEKYRDVLADNRTSAGFRPETKEMIYPIHCYKAKGSRFTDIDGNDFIDFTMGFGVNLFGHSPDFLEKAMLEQIQLGVCVGPQSFLVGEVAHLVCELTSLERTAFVNSGTEAVMTAIRLARAGTKRTKVVLFDGSYHGHFDGVLARGTADLKSIPVASGIPPHMVDDIIVLEYGSEASLQIIKDLGNTLAAVLVEPVQSRFPEHQPQQFLKEIRRITEVQGTAFVWDEVITGFRIHPGGAQAHFGIKADIAAYGKILGGGMPIGAVAGSKKYLDFIDGGHWQFGDDSLPDKEMTFFAGTFSKHPLAMATAFETLKLLREKGTQIIGALNTKTAALCQELNQFFTEQDLDITMVYFGSLFRFKANLNLDLLVASLNKAGFYIWEGRNLFMSTAHTDEDIQLFKKSIRELTLTLLRTGHFTKRKVQAQKTYPMIAPQKRFRELSAVSSLGASASHICISAKVKGFLDPLKLQQALNILARKKDLFRWRADLSQNSQFFEKAPADIDFEAINLRQEKTPWKALDKMLFELSLKNLDIEKSSPILVKLYEVVEETHVMAVFCHHLIFDGWTMTLFFEDLATIYNALLGDKIIDLPPSLNFEEFLGSENVWAKPQDLKQAELFWLNEFKGFQSKNSFAALKGISTEEYRGQRLVFDLPLKLYKELKVFSKAQRITPFMYLLGAFAKTLMIKLDKDELVIGIPAANRDFPGSDKMYGNCTNLLPIRLKDSSADPVEFYHSVKEKVIQAYQHMAYPYEQTKEKTGPLFDIYFNLEPTSDLPEFDQASLIIHPFPISASEFPLMLNITDFEHYYHCEIDFQWKAISDDFVLELIDDIKKLIQDSLKATP
ncbi:MAG TPA: aminotransferase class III-fold pyridoxal phosphate-dependent enzyme [Pseudobdellovibrionaceae bacterium]|jgi:acyl transferase domain-containing protein/acetylornithine/succinyldiaminopimelate/putrescine aminotransferase